MIGLCRVYKAIKNNKMNREVTTDLIDILDLIIAAEDYGFKKPVLLKAFSEMIGGKLSKQEIEWFSILVKESEGFTNEDYELTKEKLIEFKKDYCS